MKALNRGLPSAESASAPLPALIAGFANGRMASAISFIGLSSAATRLELIFPQTRHLWIIAHSPFFPHPDTNRLHTAMTVGLSISRRIIQMDTVQTVGAMISVICPCSGGNHRPSAYFTCKCVCTRMDPVIMLIIFFFFYFHGS